MIESEVGALTDDFKTLSKDAKELAREAQSQALEKSGELSRKVMELFDSALAAAKEVPSVAAARTREAAATTDDFVHQNPWRAVTISVGVGLLFGFLFAKK